MAKAPKKRALDFLQRGIAEIEASDWSYGEKLKRLEELNARHTEISLQKPIVRPNRLLVSSDDAERQITELRAQTIVSLAEKYKIPEKIGESDFWVSISWHLMNEFVPGFRVLDKPPRGRGRAKNPKLDLKQSEKDFISAIDRRRARGETLDDACDAVFTRFEYKTANALRVACQSARNWDPGSACKKNPFFSWRKNGARPN